MRVKAAPGIKVPKEFHPTRYITDAEPVEVIDSAYYQRRITDGDLVITTKAAPVPPVKTVKEPA